MIVSNEDNRDVYGVGWNARTRIHEYGGSPAVVHSGIVYFSNLGDLRLYKVLFGTGETLPQAITEGELVPVISLNELRLMIIISQQTTISGLQIWIYIRNKLIG